MITSKQPKLGLMQELFFCRMCESTTGYTFTPCVGSFTSPWHRHQTEHYNVDIYYRDNNKNMVFIFIVIMSLEMSDTRTISEHYFRLFIIVILASLSEVGAYVVGLQETQPRQCGGD